MNLRNKCVALLCCMMVTWSVCAQSPLIALRINGQEITLAELLYAWRCDGVSRDSGMSLEGFVPHFVRHKLKVLAAIEAGMDTTAAFRAQMDKYRKRLSECHWAEEAVGEETVRQYYNRLKERERSGAVRVEHIFKRLPQNATPQLLRNAEVLMDSIYRMLVQPVNGMDFSALAQKYSDEAGNFWISALQMPVEFEDTAWSLRPAEFSRPFFTPQGIHIVKVLERRDLLPLDSLKGKIRRDRFRAVCRVPSVASKNLLEELKREKLFVQNKAGVNELIKMGHTEKVLFTIGNRPYTGKDFALFAVSYPAGIRKQLDAFVTKSVFDYADARLESQDEKMVMSLRRYGDSLLADAIQRREVIEKSLSDEKALHEYFTKHRSDYYWERPRYKGIVLHCINRRTAKRVRKLLKQVPATEWLDAIRLVFNNEDVPKVLAEQGLFSLGDNAYVDYKIFKGKEPEPLSSFPHTVVYGRLLKGPEDYWEVRDSLVSDYQRSLEEQWVASLWAKSKVEINQEVLKTVNNSEGN